jgi:O-antigen chain-terminating methyltransferase
LRRETRSVTASDDQRLELSDEERNRLDALYKDFEDLFRGTREDIKSREQVYLPRLVQAGVGTAEMPVVDLGCGRGEWLEVLRENGLAARGVDISSVFVEECRKRDLEVVEQDALVYLRSLEDTSLGAVTGFHLLEHLPYAEWIRLLEEAVRVLRPGGLAIFETPNPANIIVGSYSFYMDPSHRNPLPSPMLKFMLEAKGLREVEVLELHPLPESFSGIEPAVAAQLNRYFCGPQDYAVIGRKS